jgi:hypothetical protein
MALHALHVQLDGHQHCTQGIITITTDQRHVLPAPFATAVGQ